MKVVAFNGSPRKNGNTSRLINHVFDQLHKEDIQTEAIWLGGGKLQGCLGCLKCFKNKDKECAVKKDKLNEYMQKMIEADGIILGSPTYFGSVSAEMKMLIDRVGLVSRANDYLLKRKTGAAVIAARRGGAVDAFNTINHLFALQQMIIPCSIYWNFAYGFDKGEVEKDEEGILTIKTLGENMAWLLKKICG